MREKVDKIRRAGKLICACSIIFGIINMIPISFGAPSSSTAFMVITAIIPVIIGAALMPSFFGSRNLNKLYASIMHLCYLDISFGISIILLAFGPISYFMAVAAAFNTFASIGLIASGACILVHSYLIARLSIVP